MKIIPSIPTTTMAKELLGCYITHKTKAGTTVGKIVETEAYLFENDPGSHTQKGKTKRNAQMFGKAGTAYVYLIYGMYHCINIVTNKEGIGEAVLIRALEPVEGTKLMKERRNKDKVHELMNGPGKLTIAMGINLEHNGACLETSSLTLKKKTETPEIVETTRIGLSQGKELPYRFYIKGNRFVSRY